MPAPQKFAALAALCVLTLGCGASAPEAAGEDWAPALALSLDPGGDPVVLAYQVPSAICPHVYRLETDYDVLPLQEERNRSTLVLAPHKKRGAHRDASGPVTEHPQPGELFYLGHRASKRGARRDMYFGRTQLGPSAPTAACTARTWDPMEDALALGFPGLSGRLTAVGEAWRGARVEGKCNKTACIDPQTYAGGVNNHHRPCVTESYQERLVGVFEVAGERVAAIESTWSDGHGTAGIWSERKTLFSVDHGRPLWSRSVIHHSFPQPTEQKSFEPITRTFTLTAIDSCEGSPIALAGSAPDGHDTQLADVLQAWDAFSAKKTQRSGRAPAGNAGDTTVVDESNG